MPESKNEMETLERVEAKLNVLAQAIGGATLRERWEKIERGLPVARQTFRRRACGCWRGREHEPGCEVEVRKRAGAGAAGGEER